LAEDLERLDILNLGFSGATVESAIPYFERLFEGIEASKLVLYFGENDIENDGLTADYVMKGMEELLAVLRSRFPAVPVYFVSIKHSPGRWAYEFETLNAALKGPCNRQNDLYYVDLSTCLLGINCLPAGRFFNSDHVHLSASGYPLWARRLKAVSTLFTTD